MKKSLIALAVAGALTAPVVAQADATLYGKVEALLQFNEDQDADLGLDDVIFGMKGSNETNIEGVSAIYQIEVELNEAGMAAGLDSESAGVSTRLAYAGLTGGFGTVLAGRIANPTDTIEGYGDLSNKAGNFYFNPDRLGSALAYVSPSFGGVTAYAGLVIENQGADSAGNEDVDGYLVGADYAAGGLALSLAYWSFDKSGSVGDALFTVVGDNIDIDNVLVGGSYTIADFTVGATYEQVSVDSIDSELWGISAAYVMGDLDLYAQYSDFDSDELADAAGPAVMADITDATGIDASGDEWAIGLNYALGGKASVGVEYSDVDYDGADSVSQYNVSYTVKF